MRGELTFKATARAIRACFTGTAARLLDADGNRTTKP
jgi:hypothetical protein